MKGILLATFSLILSQYLWAQSGDLSVIKNNAIQKSGIFSKGVVVCAQPIAANIGKDILEKGGNAFDAAIATQLALAVVYPQAGNIGGGGFMTARDAGGKLLALDFRETAPFQSSRNMYLDKNGNADMHLSQDGHLSVGVPGAVAGLFSMMQYAKLPFKILIHPAIDLARKGFAITTQQASLMNDFKADFEKYNKGEIAFVKASPWKAGDILVQKDLANTLERIRDKGAKGFYEGKTAALIVAEMKCGNGIITLQDLKNYRTEFRKAVRFNYRGYNIISFPPPSSGGLLLEQMLKMVEPFSLNKMGFHSAETIHLMTEIERRAYADRAKYMGDPDFWKVPDSTLVSDSYLKERMKTFDQNKATPSKKIAAGNIPETNETTHLCIADKEGNIVSITTTLNGNFGSRVVVKGAGFLLNDEMDDFSVKPGVPNMYGAVGGEANSIQPNKRMLSSMCPTLILKGNKPFMVVGTPGGTTIPTSVFQSIVNVIDFGMQPAEAIDAPKFHHQWLPDELFMEKGFNSNVIDSLEEMGYTIKMRGPIGRTEMILFKNGLMYAAADIRGEDSVAGF